MACGCTYTSVCIHGCAGGGGGIHTAVCTAALPLPRRAQLQAGCGICRLRAPHHELCLDLPQWDEIVAHQYRLRVRPPGRRGPHVAHSTSMSMSRGRRTGRTTASMHIHVDTRSRTLQAHSATPPTPDPASAVHSWLLLAEPRQPVLTRMQAGRHMRSRICTYACSAVPGLTTCGSPRFC